MPQRVPPFEQLRHQFHHDRHWHHAQGGEDRQVRDVVELGITLDERVADGFYFGRSLKIVQHLMSHPELLDRPLKEAIDLDC